MNSRLDDLKKIVSSQSDNPRAHFELGCAAQTHGDLPLAIECFTKVTQLAPAVAAGHFNLGNACFSLKQYAHAAQAYSRAFELESDRSTLNNLGNSLAAMGDFGQAIATYERALAHADDGTGSLVVLKNLGTAREAIGDRRGAAQAFQLALNESGNTFPVFQRLARLWSETDIDQALQLLRTRPAEVEQSPELLAVQADCLLAHNAFEPALQCLMQACDLEPDHPRVLASLGQHYFERGRHFESLVCLHRALASGALEPATHSSWLRCQLYQEPIDWDRFRQEAMRWYTLVPTSINSSVAPRPASEVSVATVNGQNLKMRNELKLHIGLVCGRHEYRRLHPFLQPLFAQAAGQLVRLSIYADCEPLDSVDGNSVDGDSVDGDSVDGNSAVGSDLHWNSTCELGDSALKNLIEADGVRVLIDLTGHTPGNRLGLFAQRSAPVQVAWAGWLATTGLENMDAILVDNLTIPADESQFYVENIVRLPGCMFCCMPPELDQADVADDSDRPTTASTILGSVCSPAQLSEKLLGTWSKLLRQLPSARLKLTDQAYGDAALRQEILAKFKVREVDTERIELIVADDIEAFLKSLTLTLDPFPWNAAEITCRSLRVGTPVIAWRGERLSCRTSASVLGACGFDDWVADSTDAYCQLAIQLAKTPVSRQRLQNQFAGSKLCDTQAWTREFVAALRSLVMRFDP